jgi:hypothetical protein
LGVVELKRDGVIAAHAALDRRDLEMQRQHASIFVDEWFQAVRIDGLAIVPHPTNSMRIGSRNFDLREDAYSSGTRRRLSHKRLSTSRI